MPYTNIRPNCTKASTNLHFKFTRLRLKYFFSQSMYVGRNTTFSVIALPFDVNSKASLRADALSFENAPIFFFPSGADVVDDWVVVSLDNVIGGGAIILFELSDENTVVTDCGDFEIAVFGVAARTEGASNIVVSVMVVTLDVWFKIVGTDEVVAVETGSALFVTKLLVMSDFKLKSDVKMLAGTVLDKGGAIVVLAIVVDNDGVVCK